MDRVVIRIRYKDLSPGLHGKAERGARGTTVYLLPGLTWGQRSAALRRLRQEASRGCGPALPGPDLAVALAADRFRVGVRNTAAVVRLHPAGSLLPTVLAGLLMTLFVLASVSARMDGSSSPSLGPAPGGTLAVAGAPTPVGTPQLASAAGAGGPVRAAHDTGGPVAGGSGAGAPGNFGGGSGSSPFSLVASSGSGSRTHSPSGSGSTGKPCGTARNQAGSQDRNCSPCTAVQCRPRVPRTGPTTGTRPRSPAPGSGDGDQG